MHVHPTAVVAEGAKLGAEVEIGPYCVIGPHVRLGEGCRLHPHVVIQGDTELGRECEVWPNVVLGTVPQLKQVGPEDALGKLRIGAHNRLREAVTIHLGSPRDRGVTTIGDHNMLLAAAHVGHDATVGNHVTLTNGAMLAGHTSVDDHAVVGAMCGIHQFVRLGKLAMLGAGAMAARDAPPFAMIQGDRARIRGVNVVGMRRAGFRDDDVAAIKRAYRLLFWREDRLTSRIERVQTELGTHPLVQEILNFMQGSKRGVMRARSLADPSDPAD